MIQVYTEDTRIAVRFAYEWHDDSGQWFRSYGNENWEFNGHGLMQRRFASINDLPSPAPSASSSGRPAAARTIIQGSATWGSEAPVRARRTWSRANLAPRLRVNGHGR